VSHHAHADQEWEDPYATWGCSCGAGGKVASMTEAAEAVLRHQRETQTTEQSEPEES